MFDGPTTDGLRLDGPLVVLDLAAVYHSPALGVLMACAAAWLQHAVSSGRSRRILLVVDEAWAILGNPGIQAVAAEDDPRLHIHSTQREFVQGRPGSL